MGQDVSFGSCNGRVAVITGGASGIGYAMAKKCLLELGMKVAIADINQERLTIAENQLKGLVNSSGSSCTGGIGGSSPNGNSRVMAVRCDVTKIEDLINLREKVYNAWGDVAFLANNAGIVTGYSSYKTSPAEWKAALDITMMGVIYGCHVFVEKMLQQPKKDCVIVNTASVAGVVNSWESTGMPYTLAKNGVRIYSEGLYQELQNSKIKVFVLCPGHVNTNLANSSKNLSESSTGQKFREEEHASPMGINNKTLEQGMTPEFVVDSLLQNIRKDNFYAIVTNPASFPKQMLIEMARFTVDDMESGKGPVKIEKRSKEQKKRFMNSLKPPQGKESKL